MNREDILHELTQWGTANSDNHGRDDLIRRAHAAGIAKILINSRTGVSRPTIDKILKEPPCRSSTRSPPAPPPPTGSPCMITTTRLAVVETPFYIRTRDSAPVTRLIVWHSEGVDQETVEVTLPKGEWTVVRGQWARNRTPCPRPQFHVRTGPARTICGHTLVVPQSLIGVPDAADRILAPVDAPKVNRWCHSCLTGLAVSAGHAHNA